MTARILNSYFLPMSPRFIREQCRRQAGWCTQLGSPPYAHLPSCCAADYVVRCPLNDLLRRYENGGPQNCAARGLFEFFSDWKSLSGGTLRRLVGCLNDGMDFPLGAAPATEKDSGPRRLGPQYEPGHKMSALHPASAVRSSLSFIR